MPVASLILSCVLLAQAPSDGRVMPTADPSPPATLEPISDAASRGDVLATPLSLQGEAVQENPTAPPTTPPTTSPDAGPSQTPVVSEPAQRGPSTTAPDGASQAAAPEGSRRRLPPEMVAEILTLPEGSTIAGRPLPLVNALAAAFDHTQRLTITHAYWRLSEALAEYGLCWRESERLRNLQVRAEDAPMLRAAQASAEAALRAAEVAVVAAQYDLAEAAGLPGQEPLPLPADLPHVGPYRTYFEEVAARQPLPARARLIDRLLPIRRRAIDVWADAVQAAEDAVEAITEAYQQGTTDLATVLEYHALLGRRQRSLIRSVCQYNHDIADYALAVAGPETPASALIGMLIKPSRRAAPRSVPSDGSRELKPLQPEAETALPEDSQVQPATLNLPLPPEESILRPSTAGQPTLAPPRDQARPFSANQPTLAPPKTSSGSEAEAGPIAEPQPDDPPEVQPSSEESPASPAPDERQESRGDSGWGMPLVPVAPGISSMRPHISYRPVADDQGTAQATAGLYPGLVAAKPSVRAQRLAEVLGRNRLLPSSAGKAITLKQCLENGIGDRRQIITAYWLARQRASEYESLVMHASWLEELLPFALERHDQPGGAEEMLRLQAARLAAKASLLESETQFLEAQFELTRRSGFPIASNWLFPATAPHAGPYLLKLEAQSPHLAASWSVKRLAATIPARIKNLEQRATAVVEADQARAAALSAYQAGRGRIDDVLAAFNRQTTETQAFVEAVTQYNGAIADYVLAILPPVVRSETLVEALVVMK